MRSLLDVNVLLALIDQARARQWLAAEFSLGWASCDADHLGRDGPSG